MDLHLKRLCAAVIAAGALGVPRAAAAPQPSTAAAQVPTQLPRTVRPTHYDVVLTPDAGALTFTGKVVISVEVLQPTPAITVNALDLTFAGVRLTGGPDADAFAPPRVAVDAAAQTATFTFASTIPRGTYRLALDYTGKIGTQAVGLFAIDYDTPAGPKRALFTQFEASDARRVIPSWDEPAYKATFSLEATVPSREMAVSNMPVAEQADLGRGRSRVRFARTPRMSTYLLFLAVGDLERITKLAGETEIGIVTQKGLTAQGAFALESSATILHEFNDYFGTPYPLPKLDNVAAPGRSQFFGAMENWGAIFSFEYILLVDPSISTESDRQTIFSVAAHEISHQWFGDLVTMAWWDDLWLNEGFASWMAGRTTEKLHPEWNSQLGAVKDRDRAMARDALATTHPVVQRIETVEQAAQAFDAITYEKGEAVIRMLEGYVGAAGWRDGVRRYMQRHAYGNTVSDDLWRAIEAAAGRPITAIAHDFTLQPGVPLITVAEATCSGGASRVSLTQGEFSKDQPDKKPLAWQVPVILRSGGAGEPVRTLVTGGKAVVTMPGCDPVIVNAGQSGYYRTLYPPPQFARIVSGFPSLPSIDQLGILADSWALGRAGLQPASDVLELAAATPAGADPQVWGQIAGIFSGIDDYARGDEARRAAFRKFAIARVAPVFATIGWIPRPGEPAPVAILRADLIETLGALGDPAVVGEARRRYAAQASDPTAIPGALRKTILGVVARHADAATWDRLHEAAIAEKTPLVKDHLYVLLSSTADGALARRALDLALTPEPGATNSAEMISRVAGEHPDLAFDFAVGHMPALNERLDATSRSRYYAGLAGRSGNPAMLGKLKAYAAAHVEEKSRRETDTAAANITDRIRVRGIVLPAIDAWLARNAAQPAFRGITEAGETEKGLYSIRSSGVSTRPVQLAAQRFLESLDATQRTKTQYDIDSDRWRTWSNTHRYPRTGVSFGQLSDAQRKLAFAVLNESLSARGLKQSEDIIALNGHLGELTGKPEEFSSDFYWLSVFSDPSATEPWGWQLDGHHLNINYLILGDQVVITPMFMGSEPVTARYGPLKDTNVFADEESLAYELMSSLSPDQRKKAILADQIPRNIFTAAFRDNHELRYEGIPHSQLTEPQRRKLRDLLWAYVGRQRAGHAERWLADVERHQDRLFFAWMGGTGPGDVFYYRIHSPVILIEFDHQEGLFLDKGKLNRNHVHSVVRTPNGNDYGKDLLRQHYLDHDRGGGAPHRH